MSSESNYQTHPPRRLWPWFLLVALGLIVGLDQGYRLILRSQIDKELAAIQKEGYPVTCRDLAAWRPPVPDKQNAAIQLLEAAENVTLPKNGFDRITWGRKDTLDAEQMDKLKSILTNNSYALESAHAAAQLKECSFPVDYSRGPGTLLPHLAKVKSVAQLLKAEAVVQAEEGSSNQAVRAVCDSLQLGRALDKEPLLISQLVRFACLSMSCATVERMLNEQPLSDAQLRQLTESFRSAREASQSAFSQGFAGEICIGTFCFTAKPAQLAQFTDNGSGDSESVITQIGLPIYAWTGLRDRDFLFYLRMMHRTLDAAKEPFPAALGDAKATFARVQQDFQNHRLLIISKMLLPALDKSFNKAAEIEGRLGTAEAGLAIERFRLAHQGALPRDLSELVPALLPTLPLDPVDGAPLRYHKLGRGYVVYSVGADGTDDGGLERVPRNTRSGHRNSGAASSGDGANGDAYDVTFTVER